MYDVDSSYNIVIGEQLENLSRTIQIDCRAWVAKWPSGILNLLIRRPREKDSYIASNVSISGGIMTWKPDRTDLEIPGDGHIQVRMQSNGSVVKLSHRWNISIPASLEPPADATPSTLPGWVEDLIDDMQDIADDAATSATAASTKASEAASSASAAAGSATTASTKASEAAGSASTASAKASEAATSATNAATSATNANASKVAAQAAQTAAETAQDAAETAEAAAEAAAAEAAEYYFVPLTDQEIINIFEEAGYIIPTEATDVMVYKGSVATYDALPTTVVPGWVYNVTDTGSNYVWTGTAWDDLAGELDYATTADVDDVVDDTP